MTRAAGEIRVLLVDDNELEFVRLSELVEGVDQPFRVDWCGTFAEAVDAFARADHDVYLIDYQLGERTGLDLLGAVGARAVEAPCIFLTNWVDDQVDRNALALGAVDFLNKASVTGPALKRVIRYGLERKRVENELRSARDALEGETIALAASLRKLEETTDAHSRAVGRIDSLRQEVVAPLSELLRSASASGAMGGEQVGDAVRLLDRLRDGLSPFADDRHSGRTMAASRVLLAEPDRKEQIVARMALCGSGVTLDTVDSVAEGERKLASERYAVALIARPFVDLMVAAHREQPECSLLLASSDGESDYLPLLEQHPFISGIIARSGEDRLLTVRNILATVAKMCTNDIFGLEKYMSWGVQVQEHAIASSEGRGELLDHMDRYLESAGVRRAARTRATMAAEELLMNAIFDAPTDAQGRPRFNHASRSIPVHLDPGQQGRFRYACDGMFVAIAAEDPFGSLARGTVLHYLDARQRGETGVLVEAKGGGGWGLYQIMKQSSLMVINVDPGRRTEVIALQPVDVQGSGTCTLSFFSPSARRQAS